jgi:NAD(P)-dependent dehydrogenase (short-subunit alcohol dehydrogenase family)
MVEGTSPARRREVVVVTGGGAGIGAAIAQALGRAGAYVVTVDPGVTVDGLAQDETPPEITADRIVADGGAARASNASVTDTDAVDVLFADLTDEFGGIDAVVNVAGISRPSGFAEGDEAAWAGVVAVHLDGYLSVLRAALPRMAARRHGRILGVTSGSGWRPANAGAYSCAKRAVAALTWQLGRVAPEGVTINALSPIAATRMVTSGLRQQAPASAGGDQSQTGGLSLALAAMPSPERLGPVGAYLGGPEFAWSSGNIVFSNGSEVAPIIPPELLEAARTTDVADITNMLDTVIPAAFVPAEAAQQTNGASNGRFEDAFDHVADAVAASGGARSCLLVTNSPAWESALSAALAARGVSCTPVASGTPIDSFADAAGELARIAEAGPIDAVVIARAGIGSSSAPTAWERVLEEHAGLTRAILADVAWVRAASDHARASAAPVRIATIVDATTSGGRSRAQVAAQLARAAHLVPEIRADAFAVGVEDAGDGRYRSVGELVAHLIGAPDAGALSGAELVATPSWIGLRSHPRPGASISFGGPDVPSWVDDALRAVLGASERSEG